MADKEAVAKVVVDQLEGAGLGAVSTKAMFGGISIRVDDAEVAKVLKTGELHMRSDAEADSAFSGDKQVTNDFGGGTPRKMPYFEIASGDQGSLGGRLAAATGAGKRAAAKKAAKKKK